MIFTQVSLSLSLSLPLSLFSSSALPPSREPSHIGQDAVDEQGHDGSAEQAGHGHSHEPSQEDIPEEAPVHCFLGTDPTHGHDWAHLEAAARRKERKQSAAKQNKHLNCQSQINSEELQIVQDFFYDKHNVLCSDTVFLFQAYLPSLAIIYP